MKNPKYKLEVGSTGRVMEFTSEGPNGPVPKIILFQNTELDSVLNLAFGDKRSDSMEPDDLVVTNNGDVDKVLATVAWAISEFTLSNPSFSIFVKGSTDSRTRLYQMKMIKNVTEISTDFEIFGLHRGNWIKFEAGKNFEAFLIRRK